ncbi:hypothetical protein [Pseudomonas sp.]|uniref:hypothetical protein n=1 Tax=Pseudomonas sp. TaxID=306 RepID=UPI003CC5E6F9
MTERETTLRIIKQELIDTRKQDDECQFGIALGTIYLAVSLNLITNRELHRLNKLALNASVHAKIQRHQHGAVILGKRITEFQRTNSLAGLLDGISPPADEAFQQRVQAWMLECFGSAIAADRAERNHRFLEEALELVQSLGCSADEAHRLVDYVYGRPTGEPVQEAGGVMVTLAALCAASELDMAEAGERELTRISQPETMLRIREKQRKKPAMSPLPGVYPERAAPVQQAGGLGVVNREFTTAQDAAVLLEAPDWLLEMAEQMRDQPTRSTAHPFWQVRCKRHLPTAEGYNDSHYEVVGDEGVVWRSIDPIKGLIDHLLENHEEWCRRWAEDHDHMEDCSTVAEAIESFFDASEGELPDGLTSVFVQEVEEVVTTHLTLADAEWFIKRKQHDYPPLYTYVESAYWSPQMRQLQDWIISLASQNGGATS